MKISRYFEGIHGIDMKIISEFIAKQCKHFLIKECNDFFYFQEEIFKIKYLKIKKFKSTIEPAKVIHTTFCLYSNIKVIMNFLYLYLVYILT